MMSLHKSTSHRPMTVYFFLKGARVAPFSVV